MDHTSGGSKTGFFDVLYADKTEGNSFGYVVAVLSFVWFNLNSNLALGKIAPISARGTPGQLWKWRNIANSLIHSFVSGSWAIINFWQTPELRHNLITAYTTSSLAAVSFSVGYFIYDLFDMAAHSKSKSTYELLLHHTLVILCFGLAQVSRYYHGYAMVALLVEINSVFLHIRQLLIIQGWKKENTLYRINSYINLGTFIIFRLMNLGWLIRWLAVHREEFSLGTTTLAYTAQLTILVMNLMMLTKILNRDFFDRSDIVKHRMKMK